jgi:glutamyl-tRNA synthetase
MKAAAEAAKQPPKYTGKWASASQADVDAALASGLTPVYRFRVPPDGRVTIQDAIRGEVSWATDAVGDFVLVRSNGLPVYNFCVAVDDALMRITHVLRAEEHLPNTLRQVLVYDALGFPPPLFGHVSLILAPDRSKLSKRHGATSVGEFREQGYLPAAMNNFLALLGWNEGTTREIYSLDELVDAFSLERVTKSPAVFDKAKLAWVNGQHLRALPAETAAGLLADAWHADGLLAAPSGAWATAAAALVAPSCELVADGVAQLRELLGYPLAAEAADEKAAPVLADGFADVAAAVLAAHASGALDAAVAGGADGWKAFVKDSGKAMGRKGKGLFMPLRLALTGKLHGPDIGEQLALLAAADAAVAAPGVVVALPARMEALRAWLAANKQ